MLSIFEMFKIGIGPSSSHTVGPMVAAKRFVMELDELGLLADVRRVTVGLYGSLGATGKGHGSDRAVLAGFEGADAATVDPASVLGIWDRVTAEGTLDLLGRHQIAMDPAEHVTLIRNRSLPGHPNGLHFGAFNDAGDVLRNQTFYSVGGGFVQRHDELGETVDALADVPYNFTSADQLIQLCTDNALSISELVMANEVTARPEAEVVTGVLNIWSVMSGCVEAGLAAEGVLPGGLNVPRRAAKLRRRLEQMDHDDMLAGVDWLGLYAMAVNEENAAGGRVVTAPTNGAAGVIPSTLYFLVKRDRQRGTDRETIDRRIVDYLLTAAAFGIIIKLRASLSGAEVGCQGEVGSACAMAAAGSVAYLQGTPDEAEKAAEMGMEHNLGLTCDPIGGLVQIPCIERNGVAASKAAIAARTALHEDGAHMVTFDQVVETMRVTGLDMRSEYRETSRGGLAVNTTLC